MTLDLILAIFHHLLVFGFAAMIAVGMTRLRPGINGPDLVRLAKLDAGYGATAGLIVAIGVLRVLYGVKGAAYYLPNPWFWGKMATFAVMGLISIRPTLTFLKWRKAQAADPAFAPADAEVAQTRRYMVWQLGLLLLVAVLAATMARLG